ncbi:hypothetical protein OXYTRIMIC_078 [Oxytricha trifallax]|uniref:Uncharacterized protein n=1 Tax=Oxytricha trifallax TaxID=1172189 RepID=A0A073ICH6_9SPIT|nr:hypothetical protein OXYTRIMIC_078 [Oxytricha trifallax]
MGLFSAVTNPERLKMNNQVPSYLKFSNGLGSAVINGFAQPTSNFNHLNNDSSGSSEDCESRDDYESSDDSEIVDDSEMSDDEAKEVVDDEEVIDDDDLADDEDMNDEDDQTDADVLADDDMLGDEEMLADDDVLGDDYELDDEDEKLKQIMMNYDDDVMKKEDEYSIVNGQKQSKDEEIENYDEENDDSDFPQ